MGIKYFMIVLVLIIAFGVIVMLLWNWLMPEIFGLPSITFLQAMGLLLLSKILLGGFFKGHHDKKRRYWRERMKKKLDSMKPEDREKYMRSFKRKCCGFDEEDQDNPPTSPTKQND